jgi:hypothetical protein
MLVLFFLLRTDLHRAVFGAMRSAVTIDPEPRRPHGILARRAFTLNQPRGLFLVLPCDPACGVRTDLRHNDIVDPGHEFLALACGCHRPLQTDGESALFKRLTMTGGGTDRGVN